MTHPTPEPTQSIRERLARRLAVRDPTVQPWLDMSTVARNRFRHDVDAILAELQEPTEGMKQAAMNLDAVKALDGAVQLAFVHGIKLPSGEPPLWQAWQAMIQHIQEGGK